MRNAVLPFALAAGVLAAGCGRGPTLVAPVAVDAAPAPAAPDRLIVERVAEADPYYRLVDTNAVVFKYTGGFIDCWIEEEQPGKPLQTKHRIAAEVLRISDLPAAPQPRFGFVVVTRRKADKYENWDVRYTIERPGQQPLGATFSDLAFGLRGSFMSVTKLDKPREVTGEVELMSVSAPMPDGELTVRVKCAPWKKEPKK